MKLRDCRKQKDLTQVELAKEAGVSQAYICALEKGRRQNPSLYILMKVAKALNIPLKELIESYEEAV